MSEFKYFEAGGINREFTAHEVDALAALEEHGLRQTHLLIHKNAGYPFGATHRDTLIHLVKARYHSVNDALIKIQVITEGELLAMCGEEATCDDVLDHLMPSCTMM